MYFPLKGNAALVLRSRLKVKVVKEHREKKAVIQNGIEENGVIAPSLEKEMFKQVMQYQVSVGGSGGWICLVLLPLQTVMGWGSDK